MPACSDGQGHLRFLVFLLTCESLLHRRRELDVPQDVVTAFPSNALDHFLGVHAVEVVADSDMPVRARFEPSLSCRAIATSTSTRRSGSSVRYSS